MSISAGLSRTAAPLPGLPAQVPGATALPLRISDFDAALTHLYHEAVAGAPTEDILASLCRQLSALLNLRLVILAGRLDNGAMAVQAASRENGLWLELQHIPERWDSGLSSLGPAGECLRAGAPIRMSIDSEGLALWRRSAMSEQVGEVLALPLASPARVLELYFAGPVPEGARSGTLSVQALMARLDSFLADISELRWQALLARALACSGNGAFVTDLEGTIVWCNPAFSRLSGYSPEEVVGRNPNVLRSGEQGVRYYRDLWSTIRSGQVWSGETIDRAKDGHPYVIRQTISPVAQADRVTHYLSMHHDIGRERHRLEGLELASQLQPGSGLLTRAAFDRAAHQTLAAADWDASWLLVLVSARGLRRLAPELDAETEDLLDAVMAGRLTEFVQPGEYAGQHGDFEYALLLRSRGAAAGIGERLGRLAESLGKPVVHAGGDADPDIHLGTAQFRHDGESPRALMRQADRKLADEPSRRASRKARH